ncbi:hypothetical protein HPB50_008796 [Hyalomma asiaticum]|uniref:Uncharacterized protein n=1 Tax=Hyalomma asiaticum TaxID=266040 RepID=A0ACB7TGX4_HYAAI|nr:hypothetical protein HPB50_008796 [Hyalomma asiaticum]
MSKAEDAAASPAEKRQKTYWSDDETCPLIKVWEDHLPDLRRAKRDVKIYLAIQGYLRAQDIEKSVKEIKSKIENLGNRYRKITRKTTGQNAITWRFYKDIARFLGSLLINNMSLLEETRCGDDTTVQMIIHTMEHGTTAEDDDVLLNDATERESASAPTQESHNYPPRTHRHLHAAWTLHDRKKRTTSRQQTIKISMQHRKHSSLNWSAPTSSCVPI